ncbi:MAG TPA: class I adenylate-forming enzyme family protein [Opitutaceae bacterium]|nr:class I adenylate-forming enzyme family protein [Opitutaceae bacterium]
MNDASRREDASSALQAAWRRTVARDRDRTAVVEATTGRSCTFGELDARAAEWCSRHDGAAKLRGGAVVFAVPNGIRWFEILLGLVRAGAVAVPLDASEPAGEQERVATALRAAGWWNGEALLPRAGARRFRDREVAFMKLTSGSTGQPRPLVFTGAELLADAAQILATMRIRRSDVNYALIPLGHSYGLGNLTLPLVAHGIPVVCGATPLPHAIAQDFGHFRPTVFPGVPAIWRALAAANVPAAALEDLRLAISAGAPLPTEVAGAFAERFGRRIHAFYGSSETGGIAFDRTGTGALRGGVGTAMKGVTLRLENGGRLCVRSAAVFSHGNRRRVLGHPCWVMPDRVSIDGNGALTLLGRRGSTVKIAGRRINLAELAGRIRRLPGVQDAWVGVSEGAEPILGAAVITDRSVAEIRSALRSELTAWKVPKKIATLAGWPLTARGKTDLRILKRILFGAGGPVVTKDP